MEALIRVRVEVRSLYFYMHAFFFIVRRAYISSVLADIYSHLFLFELTVPASRRVNVGTSQRLAGRVSSCKKRRLNVRLLTEESMLADA